MLIVVPLSLLAALLFTVGAVLQQNASCRNVRWYRTGAGAGVGTSAVAGAGRPPRPAWVRTVAGWLPASALIGRLLRDPLWRLGWGVQTLGFLVQAAALYLGSIAVVQPLLVTQLLFTLLLSAAMARRPVGWPDWTGAALVCGGLTILFTVDDAAPVTGSPDRPRLLVSVAVICIATSALIVAAAGAKGSPALRTTLLATGAGLVTCVSAAATKMTTFEMFHQGLLATARDWPGYLLAAATALALLLSQDAFAAGPLPAAVTALTVTSPIGGYLLGILAFHASPPTRPGSLAAVSAAGLLVIAGVIVLARSPNVAGPFPVPPGGDGRAMTPSAAAAS